MPIQKQIPNTPEKPKSQFVKRFLFSYSLAIILVLTFALGIALGSVQFGSQASLVKQGQIKNADEIPEFLSQDVDFKQFWNVWQYVQDNFVSSDVSETQLFYGAISGILDSLDDPYSVFFDPDISARFEQELAGSFEGIGAEIGIRDDRLTIIAPLPDTPAEKSGLQAGDIVVAIDEFDTFGIALDYAVSIIRGPKGEEVILTVFREGDDAPHDIPIVRDTIEIDSVRFSRKSSDLINGDEEDEFTLEEGDIAYIELLYFNENTLADWDKTIQTVLLKDPKGIVLDLRNNPGGFLNTAIEVAGDWVDGKVVVSEKLRAGTEIHHAANRRARLEGIPTVVLVKLDKVLI